jgi:hypothetical protein
MEKRKFDNTDLRQNTRYDWMALEEGEGYLTPRGGYPKIAREYCLKRGADRHFVQKRRTQDGIVTWWTVRRMEKG